MLYTQSSTTLPASPLGQFTPRREFTKSTSSPASFCLIAIGGNNLVRLTNFPTNTVNAIRSTLDTHSQVRRFGENAERKLYDFELQGKPWANAKNVDTENLLVNIFKTLMINGYQFVSTIDYGREPSDRISLAFSRPIPSAIPSNIAPPSSNSVLLPFALSFPSPKILRVVNAPLHSTPAILQTVRSAWPRGVVSERKCAEASYEFKLKGYSWFQDDNFSEDSLTHILSLLSSFSAHGFNLLTSLSISGSHSRTKDLWIFAGLVPDTELNSRTQSRDNNSSTNLIPLSAQSSRNASLDDQGSQRKAVLVSHARAATSPTSHSRDGSGDSQSPPIGHMRGMTESPSVLRKRNRRASAEESVFLPPGRSPRAAVIPLPINEHDDPEAHIDTGPYPPHVTGRKPSPPLGAPAYPPQPLPEVIYSTPRELIDPSAALQPPQPAFAQPAYPPAQHLPSPPSPPPGRPMHIDLPQAPPFVVHQQEPQTRDPPVSPLRVVNVNGDSPQTDSSVSEGNPDAAVDLHTPTPPLLPSSAFRDSAFSSSTDRSFDVPIAWKKASLVAQQRGENGYTPDEGTHGGPTSNAAAQETAKSTSPGSPPFPGGWITTPAVEDVTGDDGKDDVTPMPGRHEDKQLGVPVNTTTAAAVVTPSGTAGDVDAMRKVDVRDGLKDARKSQSAEIEISPVSPQSLGAIPPLPITPKLGQEKGQGGIRGDSGVGWVMVNVGNANQTDKEKLVLARAPEEGTNGAAIATELTTSPISKDSSLGTGSPSSSPASPSPAAMIAAEDAARAAQKKPSVLRRWFSRSKKNSGGSKLNGIYKDRDSSANAQPVKSISPDKRMSIN